MNQLRLYIAYVVFAFIALSLSSYPAKANDPISNKCDSRAAFHSIKGLMSHRGSMEEIFASIYEGVLDIKIARVESQIIHGVTLLGYTVTPAKLSYNVWLVLNIPNFGKRVYLAKPIMSTECTLDPSMGVPANIPIERI